MLIFLLMPENSQHIGNSIDNNNNNRTAPLPREDPNSKAQRRR